MYKKQFIRILLVAGIMISMFSITSYAQLGGGSDATIDILGGARFEGAVEWANRIGKFVDNWFMAFISFVSFFIISAACLRNVLAGAYCVFPKFWDRVDEAHKSRESVKQQGWFERVQAFSTGGGWKNTGTGSITEFLLGVLPNVKVLTDFENAQDPDYKQYFMRAIPQAVLAVFVGVFIYNGYYRDVMIVTSQFGSRVTLNALNSIDPDEILYKLSNISGIPDYPVKNVKEGTDYMADLLVTQMAKAIRQDSAYPDQNEKDNKAKLYQQLSAKLSNICEKEFSAYKDTKVWSPTVGKASVVPQTAWNESKSDGLHNDGMSYQKTIHFSVAELGLDTEYHKGEDMIVYCALTLNNQGANDSGIDTALANDWVLTIGVPYRDGQYVLPSGSGGTFDSSSGEQSINGIKVVTNRDILTIKGSGTFNNGELYPTNNIRYASNSPAATFTIAAIRFKEGATTSLTSSNLGITVKWGGDIQEAYNAKKQSSKPTAPDGDSFDNDSDDADDNLIEGAK